MLENVCIESTTDYNKFSEVLVGNRGVIESNVKKLVASMSDNQLASIAIVNKDNQIVDGQHRYAACRELGLPFYYIQMPNYGIEEVHVLNTNMKNWSNDDFVRQFAERYSDGEKIFSDYFELVKFMDKEHLTLSQALIILERGRKSGSESLRNGTFKIIATQEERYEDLKELLDLESELGSKTANTTFWQCYCLCKQVDKFSGTQFFIKAKQHKQDLQDCKNSLESFLSLFETVYNYKSRNDIAITFPAKQIYKNSKSNKD